MSTATKVGICRVDEILVDTGVGALVDGEPVAVFRLAAVEPGGSEELYAVAGTDPFTQVAVLSRGLIGSADGDPYVASPLYKQRFSLQTGQCLDDESVRLKTYKTSVVDGLVLVDPSQGT